MRRPVIGSVTNSHDPAFAVDDMVCGVGQWASYSGVDPALSLLIKLDHSLADVLQHFGTLGLDGGSAFAD
jgi:NADPH-dependent curcumin reductase CurA